MKLVLNGVNMALLHDDALCRYTLCGDASQLHIKNQTAWSCMVLDSSGKGEVLFGLSANNKEDSHSAELLPYLTALRSLKNQMQEKPRYRERIHIITDAKNLVEQFTRGISNQYTEAQWRELHCYEQNYFDIHMEHTCRESPGIQLMDRICRILNSRQQRISEIVAAAINEGMDALRK